MGNCFTLNKFKHWWVAFVNVACSDGRLTIFKNIISYYRTAEDRNWTVSELPHIQLWRQLITWLDASPQHEGGSFSQPTNEAFCNINMYLCIMKLIVFYKFMGFRGYKNNSTVTSHCALSNVQHMIYNIRRLLKNFPNFIFYIFSLVLQVIQSYHIRSTVLVDSCDPNATQRFQILKTWPTIEK